MTSRPLRTLPSLVLALALLGAGGSCSNNSMGVPNVLVEKAQQADALGLSDELEALIAEGKDKPEDRSYAYHQIQGMTDNSTAAYAFARAAVTGRYVQARGLSQGPLVAEVERYARQSRTLDLAFRNSAATRLLGTLYVMVPAGLLKHGNSEEGLSLLEGLVKQQPDVPENRLRLAEAYISLGDTKPAYAHLCSIYRKTLSLRKDEQKLYQHLVGELQPALDCEHLPTAPSAKPSAAPSATPSATPSASPSAGPSATPSASPSAAPSAKPAAKASGSPSAKPAATPPAKPSAKPAATPPAKPSAQPKAPKAGK